MQKTLQSLIHSFVLSNFITNISHYPSRGLLRRIVIFYGLGILGNSLKKTGKSFVFLLMFSLKNFSDIEYLHLPDFRKVSGLLDLLSACTLAILGNVLDFRTYSAPNQEENGTATTLQKKLMLQYDRNNIPANERMAICHARGVGLAIFEWIRSSLLIKAADGKVIEDLPSRFIVQVLCCLLSYKEKALRRMLKGAPHCTLKLLKAQVENVVKCDPLIEVLWNDKGEEAINSLKYGLHYALDQQCTIDGPAEPLASVSAASGK
jgi:hypothetical protein